MITMKNIIKDDNKLIRQKSLPVSMPLSKEDRQLVLDMHEYLVNSQTKEVAEEYDLRPGVGLAAVQVGVLKRMLAIHILDFDDEGNITKTTDYALVNPKVISYTQKQAYLADGEGCLSVDQEVKGYVPRHAKVTITAFDALTNQDVKIVARGFLAICLQHELDHLEGILFYDRINKDNPLAPIPDAMIVK